jgi:protein O-mannosyl-transferase
MKQRARQHANTTGPRAAKSARVWQALAPLILVALSIGTYLNAGHKEFFFDSAGTLIENPRILNVGQTFARLFTAPLSADEQLAHLSFALNYAVNHALGRPGLNVTTFLAFNVLVHALNVCLVYLLLRALLQRLQPAQPTPIGIPLVLAALFAVHPLHASSVVYVAQRRGEMAATFVLLGVLAYLRLRGVTPWKWTRTNLLLVGAIPLCLWLGYRSKSIALTFPLVILALEFSYLAPNRAALRRYLRYLLPAVLACLALGGVFLWAQGLLELRHLRILPHGQQLQSPGLHFLTEARAFVHYWKLLLLPLPVWMSIDHDFPLSTDLLHRGEIFALAFHAALLTLAVLSALRGYVLAAAGVLWFYVTLLPYAIVPQTELLVEYKTYLPSVGLVLILAELLQRRWLHVPQPPKLAATCIVAALLLVTTVRRNVIYQSPVNLWTDALAKYPHSLRPHSNLASVLLKQGRVDEAMTHFEAALQIAPASFTSHTGLGLALVEEGRIDEAIAEYNAALRIDPDYPDAHLSLGTALSRLNRLDEANTHYLAVLSKNPDNPEAHNNLGINLAKLGRDADALEQFAAAVRLRPDYPDAHFNRALTLTRLGRNDEALQDYRTAIRLKPDYFAAHYKFAAALAALGQTEPAIKHYTEALRLRPDLLDAELELGDLLARLGRTAEAASHYQRVLQLNPENAAARHRLTALTTGGSGEAR